MQAAALNYEKMSNYRQLSEDYEIVEQALKYLEQNYRQQPDLAEIAASVGFSEYHFQRLFTRWVGISPKRFMQYLTKEYAKALLDRSTNLLDTAYSAGLSSPGRLHDLFVACEAVTPGQYKQRGSGLTLSYGFHPTPFGECLLAFTGRGICSLIFVQEDGRDGALADLRRLWPQAELLEDPQGSQQRVGDLFSYFEGRPRGPLSLYLNGTNFQIKVWEALLHIPSGGVVSYQDLAAFIGMPSAARAVSNAVGANPLPVLIPCHRVIRKMGAFGGYGYGTARKKAIIGWEAARVAA